MLFSIISVFFFNNMMASGNNSQFKKLETGFINVPDTSKFAVYWYWMSDNISKQGVINDLHSMKKAGINRAYIGNIGLKTITFGKVKVLSDEWWEIMHAALKTATELNIEIGIFNSPGWSQSGGPWVKQEESMRYLASESKIVQANGKKMNIDLPLIDSSQDVKVIAYPYISVIDRHWSVDKQNNIPYTLLMDAPSQEMLSLICKVDTKIKTTANLYCKINNEYKLLKSFDINRSNDRIQVGFDPYAPIVIALPSTNSKEYKLVIDKPGKGKIDVCITSKACEERYPEKTLAKMFQKPLPMWADYLWNEQPEVANKKIVVDPKSVIDLTSFRENDKLVNAKLSKGKWNIVRYAMKTTGQTNSPASPEAIGLEVDKMSKKHIETHFNAFLGEILRRIPAQDRKTFKIAVMDSYETGGQNWTDDMQEKFVETYGYNPIPYLPVLRGEVVGSRDVSDRFLWDLRRLIADRIAYDYVGGLRDVCHKNGLTTWLENYGHWGFPGEFLQYGGQSDEVSGEFWSEGSLGDIENKAASSCAHIYGKNKVWAESFTAGNKAYARYPYIMKQRGDRFFTEGINSTLLHFFIQQAYEDTKTGINVQFGNEFNRKNIWFSQIDLFINYLKRCNVMLQNGKYIADVAYFIGEDTPKMTGITDPTLPKGYSFDYINGEVLMKYASVSNGILKLNSGMEYRVLVLPKLNTMRPELLNKIKEFVNNGLIVFGPKPTNSPSLSNYPNADNKVKSIANELWADNKTMNSYGKGKVYADGYDFKKILSENSIIPDMLDQKNSDINNDVLFIHRANSEGDIYFISNQVEKITNIAPTFRVKGKQPELWNPLTGEIRLLTEYEVNENGIMIPLKLYPFESSFIIFRNNNMVKLNGRNFPKENIVKKLTSNWKIRFNDSDKLKNKEIKLDSLNDWIKFTDNNIKYYAGIATYSTTFNIDKITNETYYLDLGKVMVMGKVFLNGEYIGGVWTEPYRLPLVNKLKKGENILKVEVVNNWLNRIIGDMNLPKEQRTTNLYINPWKATTPLQASGLLGPVKIVSALYGENVIIK